MEYYLLGELDRTKKKTSMKHSLPRDGYFYPVFQIIQCTCIKGVLLRPRISTSATVQISGEWYN